MHANFENGKDSLMASEDEMSEDSAIDSPLNGMGIMGFDAGEKTKGAAMLNIEDQIDRD